MADNLLLTVRSDGTEVLWIRRGLIPAATICNLAALLAAAHITPTAAREVADVIEISDIAAG